MGLGITSIKNHLGDDTIYVCRAKAVKKNADGGRFGANILRDNHFSTKTLSDEVFVAQGAVKVFELYLHELFLSLYLMLFLVRSLKPH